MRLSLSLSLGVWLTITMAWVHGAGFVHNENFVVLTEATVSQQAADEFARSILAAAETHRKQIAVDWLGEELPLGIGRATINVRFTSDRDSGLTWAVDNPERKLHTVYLYMRADEPSSSALAHEMAHVVLATQFAHPHRLPAWIEEGIASQYDNAARRQTRGSVLRFFARQEHWPRVEGVLAADNIPSEDTRSYAVAVSLTEMLLELGDRRTFLEFGQAIGRDGVQPALKRYYQVRDMDELQNRWQGWVAKSIPRDALSQWTPTPTRHGQ